ncbi:MAG: 50S ribosomal protein L11 methyltransferase [Salibacteraceae bacterium]|nr:50S ribosomal protein L11 methyltransferase [Salibacteraceae bacterium]|tara:strand:+ start:3360 stop:4187 length:828 start_codon:yes stop_codon:yes gene_type:complete
MKYIEVEFTFDPEALDGEIVLAEIAELPFESFAEETGKILAYAQEEDFDKNVLKDFQWLKENSVEYKFNEINDVNWNEEWEKNFDPIEVSEKCIVRATFHNIEKKYEYDLLIDPKMSFGTGHHATTYLVLKNMFSFNFEGAQVLDMGTGTGVLAVLAIKLGADHALAIDNNEWAFDNAMDNIKLNNCEGKINVEIGESELIEGKTFDYILANINRNVILSDLPLYEKSLSKNGALLISGIMTHDVEHVMNKAKEVGLILESLEEKDNWNLFVFKK